MLEPELESYVAECLRRGRTRAEVRADLIGLVDRLLGGEPSPTAAPTAPPQWGSESAAATPAHDPAAASPARLGLGLGFSFRDQMSPAHMLLFVGGLVIVLSGVIFAMMNWHEWGAVGRIVTFLGPLLLVQAAGMVVHAAPTTRRFAMAVFTPAAALVPLSIAITLVELKILDTAEPRFYVALFVPTFAWYMLSTFIFPHPIWWLLDAVAGLLAYLALLASAGLLGSVAEPGYAWALIPAAALVFGAGLRWTLHEQVAAGRMVGGVGLGGLLVALFRLGVAGDLVGGFGGTAWWKGVCWSNGVLGVLLVAAEWGMGRFEELRLFRSHGRWLRDLGVIWVLGALFSLGLGGEEPLYEFLFLAASLGCMFGSVPARSTMLLRLGTLALVVSVFSVAGEYFEGTIGWPATLFAAGGVSMGVGIAMGRLQKQVRARGD
ncbi:MAG: hypothetical protein HZA54_01280 [Planctomycetes bacterium]|nr:hypothetical protein [Planctomycetota bacterium]